MKDFISNLLNIGITAGLSDREAFVQNVSEVIQNYQDNPQKAEKLAKAVTTYLEQVKDNINTKATIKSAITDAGLIENESVTELTQSIQELTKELRRFREKK